jgi:nitrate reductase molybdenum cofactor assembly chaperone NarJ/NarW
MSDAFKLLSLLLQYPSPPLLEAREELLAAAADLPRGHDGIKRFALWSASTPRRELQERYVDTFDFQRRHSLYLSYHTFGDRRQRGMALLALKQRYAAAGLDLHDGELPDYLPVMLEACAIEPEFGIELLARHREPIELVRSSLHAEGSPWADLLDVVVAGLPGLTRRQVTKIARLAEQGPPEEEVGLEPFGPPEVMPEPVR